MMMQNFNPIFSQASCAASAASKTGPRLIQASAGVPAGAAALPSHWRGVRDRGRGTAKSGQTVVLHPVRSTCASASGAQLPTPPALRAKHQPWLLQRGWSPGPMQFCSRNSWRYHSTRDRSERITAPSLLPHRAEHPHPDAPAATATGRAPVDTHREAVRDLRRGIEHPSTDPLIARWHCTSFSPGARAPFGGARAKFAVLALGQQRSGDQSGHGTSRSTSTCTP